MFECLIMGDSIAVGVGQYRPECATIARVGITSEKWFNTHKDNPSFRQSFKVVVISLGTNDFKNQSAEYLYDIRARVKANMVVWLLPSQTLKPVQRVIVREIANEFKDSVMDISQFVGPDKIHPTGKGYIEIGNNILKK